MPLQEKIAQLRNILEEMEGALTAYSGGADSAFLAEMAHRALGASAIAVTADSPSLPRREFRAAVELARARGWRHEVVSTRELSDERYSANPTDRCYFCKSALFDVLVPMSEETGFQMLLGTNLDDLGDWRPGQAAADERGARHPLVEVGLGKQEVRRASRRIGLPTHDKPASACLSSRFAYGVEITAGGLSRVERAEDHLVGRGFSVVRVRDLGEDRARVEVGVDEVLALQAMAPEVEGTLRGLGFSEVIIDERGYRQGALNEGVLLPPPTVRQR